MNASDEFRAAALPWRGDARHDSQPAIPWEPRAPRAATGSGGNGSAQGAQRPSTGRVPGNV
jgi:hypothetical protein